MSGIPNEIPEYGDARLKPRQNPEFTPGADFGTEDYFVWSRCDGTASLHDIILMVGLGTSKSIQILSKLRSIGAILLPGETVPPVLAARPTRTTTSPVPASPPSDLPPGTSQSASFVLEAASDEERGALEIDIPLERSDRIRILMYRRRLGRDTLFDLLEVDADSDKREIKRAYFRLSKEFHPDRHFGKELGPFEKWLNEVFKAVTDAFKVLGNNKKRAVYQASLRGDADSQKPQTREEHAQALFQSACDAELGGLIDQALKVFAAAIRMDQQPRYLRRAAMCAAQARELSVAEEYAKRAALLCKRDASYWRVLADVYRAGAKLEDAQEVLERALLLDTENDILFGELQSDLAAVKASIADKQVAEEGP